MKKIKQRDSHLKSRRDLLNETPSILKFFKPANSIHRRRMKENLGKRNQTPPRIAISWRPDGEGTGARYDHITLQTIVQCETVAIDDSTREVQGLGRALQDLTYRLPFGTNNPRYNCIIPNTSQQLDNEMGLLVLPGVSAKEYGSAAYAERKKRELTLIRKARLTGRPILAICGGTWLLYEAYGGSIAPVKDHNYRGGMPRLSKESPQISHNKMVHRINIVEWARILWGALDMSTASIRNLPVNSVHGYAPSNGYIPVGLSVAAMSLADDELAPIKPQSETKEVLKPQECIEAVESTHGAPVLGVQWHPEAFTDKYKDHGQHHRHLLQWMANAGQTYLLRQEINKQINTQRPVLRPTDRLHPHLKVRKQQRGDQLFFQIVRYPSSHAELRHRDELKWEIHYKESYLRSR